MVQSIELLLDDEAEERIRSAWAALAAAGLPSLAAHTGDTNRPHVTALVTESSRFESAIDALRAVLDGWDLAGAGLSATIGGPLLLGGHRQRWVPTRQVVASRPLLTLHSALHRAVGLHGGAPVAALTRPDAWTPHVSLARRLPGDRLGDALAAIDAEPFSCRFRGARLWDAVEKTVTSLA